MCSDNKIAEPTYVYLGKILNGCQVVPHVQSKKKPTKMVILTQPLYVEAKKNITPTQPLPCKIAAKSKNIISVVGICFIILSSFLGGRSRLLLSTISRLGETFGHGI